MVIRDHLEEKKAKLVKKIADIENKDFLTREENAILKKYHAQLRWINQELVANG